MRKGAILTAKRRAGRAKRWPTAVSSGSRHIDNHSVADFIAAADLDAPLVVVCYHGNSSQSAAAYFIQQGFSDVYSLDGGFELWRSVYPADTSSGEAE